MKQTEKHQARELYFQLNLPQTKIAEILNLDRKTISRWMEEDKWCEMKYAAQQMPGMLLQDLYNQLSCLHARIHSRVPERQYPTDEESIIQRRLMMSIKNAEKQSVGNYMQIMTEIINEVAKQSPQLALDLTPYTDKIIKKKLDKKTFRKNAMFLTDEPYIEEEQLPQEQPSQIIDNGSSPSGEIEGQALANEIDNPSPPLEESEEVSEEAFVPQCDISENIITASANDSSPSIQIQEEKNISDNWTPDYDKMPADLRDAWYRWWAAKDPYEEVSPEIYKRLQNYEYPPAIVPKPKSKQRTDINAYLNAWMDEADRENNKRPRW